MAKEKNEDNIIDKFIEDFNRLLEKHKIGKHASTFIFEDQDNPIFLYKTENQDLLEATRILKMAHTNCKQEIARRTGDLG